MPSVVVRVVLAAGGHGEDEADHPVIEVDDVGVVGEADQPEQPLGVQGGEQVDEAVVEREDGRYDGLGDRAQARCGRHAPSLAAAQGKDSWRAGFQVPKSWPPGLA